MWSTDGQHGSPPDGGERARTSELLAAPRVQAASLYWHVRGKEELLDLMADALVGGVDLSTPPSDWREQTRVLADRYRAHLKSRRDAARVVSGRFVMGPNAAAKMEHSLCLLCQAGTVPAARRRRLISVDYVQGFVVQESTSLRTTSGRDPTASVSARFAALPTDAFPRLAEVSPYLTTLNMDDRLDWGLQCILDGLALRLAASERQPTWEQPSG